MCLRIPLADDDAEDAGAALRPYGVEGERGQSAVLRPPSSARSTKSFETLALRSLRSATDVPPDSTIVVVSLGALSRFSVDRLSRQRRVRVLQLEIIPSDWISSLRSRAASHHRQKGIGVLRPSVDTVLSASGWDASTTDLGFHEASVSSTSTSAAARAAHSASRSTSIARVVNSERRNQTTLCFPQRSTARCSA